MFASSQSSKPFDSIVKLDQKVNIGSTGYVVSPSCGRTDTCMSWTEKGRLVEDERDIDVVYRIT